VTHAGEEPEFAPLSAEEFVEWLVDAVEVPLALDLDSNLQRILQGDQLKWFRMVREFDVLTTNIANPDSDIRTIDTVRDLYLYYLYVISRPL
jgi:hypothetical protein